MQSTLPGKAVFVHDPPEGSASVQSPGPSAFGSSSEASQGPSKTGEQNTIKKTEPLRRHGRLENEDAAAQLHGPIMPRNCTIMSSSTRYKINNAWRCGSGENGGECACGH